MCVSQCTNYCLYNYIGLKPFYCIIHKKTNMIDTRLCCKMCDKKAVFNGYCAIHEHFTKRKNKRKNIKPCDVKKRVKNEPRNIIINDFNVDVDVDIDVDIDLLTIEELENDCYCKL